MKYIIDYRNGGMGNSVLAHALYSCNQVNLNLDNFFSDTGHSHAILALNQTDLIAFHELEYGWPEEKKVILSIECKEWYEILRKKLSYEKWYRSYPTQTTYSSVFGFTEPVGDQSYFENLVTKYFDSYYADLNSLPGVTMSLEKYLSGDASKLKETIEQNLNWKWDELKSQQFYVKLLEKNKSYLDWLDKIKHIVAQCNNFQTIEIDLLFWEKAIVVSKVCYDLGVNPKDLHWNDYSCFLEKNTVSFINSIKRLKNVNKTI